MTADFAEDEVPKVTGDLKFDFDTSLDPILDEFIAKLSNQLSITHTLI